MYREAQKWTKGWWRAAARGIGLGEGRQMLSMTRRFQLLPQALAHLCLMANMGSQTLTEMHWGHDTTTYQA